MMIGWIVLLIVMLSAAVAALLYLTTRFARFIPEEIRTHIGKWKTRAIGAIPVVFFIAYSIIDPVNGVLVTVFVALIWLITDAVGYLIRRITRMQWKKFYIAGVVAIVVSAVYFGLGWIAAHRVEETRYRVRTDKDIGLNSLRIAQISDSHIGALFDGDGFAKHLETIRGANPELLVITGDFVDDGTTREDMIRSCQALGEMNLRYGIFFVYGNHDKGYFQNRNFTDEEFRTQMKENGVTILEDEKVMIGEKVCLIGRKDRSEGMREGSTERMSMDELIAGTDSSLYTIVLDHQPNDYDAEEKADVDLVLSGHTHGGQLIPIGQFGALFGINDQTYGIEKRNNTTFIVNSGIADWEIQYKTGAISEYVIVDIV